MLQYNLEPNVSVYMYMCVCVCVCVFTCNRLATKVFISKLLAMG